MAKTANLNYIKCAGVRVPSNWSLDQLREALAKRDIRFLNEDEITAVFGRAIELKASLEANITQLQAELARLEKLVQERKKKVRCPKCGLQWTEAPIVTAEAPDSKKGT